MTHYPFELRSIVGAVTLAVSCLSSSAFAVSSAEMYTAKSYFYGRFTARIRFAAGDGVVSSFFMWKDGSEKAGTFWNELDFEKLGADCHLETNALYGTPSAGHVQKHASVVDSCSGFHTYTYEWTPDYIAWFVDDVEIRRDAGATAKAFAENATAGMQIRFNIWPGDASFGGNFKPEILPVHQYVNWIEYYSYAEGAFTLAWREDFSANSLPAGWLTGSWGSPKNLSTHKPGNVNFVDGYAVLSLTADDALGAAGATPSDDGTSQAAAGSGGSNVAGSATTGGSGTAGAGGANTGGNGAAGNATAAPPVATSPDDGGCSLISSKPRGSRGMALILAAVGAILCSFGRAKGRR